MKLNLGVLVLGTLLGLSTPSIAHNSPRVDESSIRELSNLALRCGQKRRVEVRAQSYPYSSYRADEYTLQLNDGSGVRFTFRDGGYDPFGVGYIPPNGIVDDHDSVNFALWDLSGFCTIGDGCNNNGGYPFPYVNRRTAESIELLKKSIPPFCLNPNIC